MRLDVLLRLKHWQMLVLLLLPVFIVPFRFQTSALFFSLSLWLYAIADGSVRRSKPSLQLTNTPIIVALIYSGGYGLFFNWFLATLTGEPGELSWIVPLHFLATVALFYVLAATAKRFKIAVHQRPINFSSYIGTFFLLWFFPIGIWFLQPKVNALVAADNEEDVDGQP